ncbi:hypothetical protein QR680_019017 [Steinernema hermaphroditum]|uniref:UBX domain-containing protein n=1 Tax=Steinernema hermaphroditum TaxID=289476 RepID=A0AA39HKP6_9BILA|nr:hypothetical protein QR680_019017 [Steinernema hermaphroditum]
MCVVSPQQVTLTLKLWEDGFSIDDGPLRRFHASTTRKTRSSWQRMKKPKTKILSGQSVLIRLPSGRRVAAEFGPSETVAHLRSYMLKMDPMLENQPFRLLNAATRTEIPIGESSLSSERLFKTLVIVRLDPK